MRLPGSKGRKHLIVLAVSTLAALCSAVAIASAEASGEATPTPPAPPADFAAEVPRDEQPQAPSLSIVESSGSAYSELSDAEALETLSDEFAPMINAELIPEPHLPQGSRIGDYLDQRTALVVPDSAGQQVQQVLSGEPSQNLLLESSLPLRAPEGGAQRPLDGDLEQVGDHFEADNPIINADISSDIDEGATLERSGVALAPLQTEATEAVAVSDKVFYPNAMVDTDYVIAPTATGFQVLAQLRSPNSPSTLPLDVDMPAGYQLRAGPDGTAVVASGDQIAATISSPRAFDAAGQDVPVDYQIDGDRLLVEVASNSGAYQWPIMVDPIVDEYEWCANQANPDISFWTQNSNFDTGFNSFYHTNEGGLMNRALGGKTYQQNAFGQWVGGSIRWSYIERVDYLNFDRSPTQPGACTVMGIYQPWTANWAPTTFYNPASNSSTYSGGMSYCSNSAHESRFVWAGTNAMPDGTGGDPESADMSQAIFQLSSSPGYRTNNAENLLRGAKVYRYDRNETTLTSPTPSSAWTRSPIPMSVHDPGLGAAGVWVIQSGTYNIVGSASTGCAGGRQSLCPTDASYQVSNLPEGRMNVVGVGIDPVLNGGPGQAWTARIDRSPPAISLSGSLLGLEGQAPTPAGTYTLGVSATDGKTDVAANERSGMASIEILVDDVRAAYQSQSCSSGSCPQTMNWTYNTATYGLGPHTITMIATDQLGHQTIDELSVGEEEVPFDGSTLRLSNPLEQDLFGGDPLPPISANDPTYIQVTGMQTDGEGCTFNLEATLLPEEESATQQVVDYDAETCTAKVERQTTTAAAPSNNQPSRLRAEAGAGATTDAIELGGTTGSNIDSSYRVKDNLNSVIAKIWTEDPPNINVSEQKVRVAWHPRNGCADGGKERVTTHTNWYEPSGWNHDLHQASAKRNCYQVKAVVHDWFENTEFCSPFHKTIAHYSPTTVKGFGDGGARAIWKYEVSGDCGDLLDTQLRLYRRH